MVDSTQLAQKDERAALALIEEQEVLARSVVEEHHGRFVKSTGDGLLLEFESALDAVESAVDFQRRIHERNARPAVVPLRVRVGVHLGDVQRREGDIFGDAVNIAARVESVAEPGEVCISESVFGQVRNKVPYELVGLGARYLKGVTAPVELFRVELPWARAGTPPTASSVVSGVPRLAVLPLANISPDTKDEYFADGLTDELISVLSKIEGLRVIARTSVVPYKSSSKSVAQIGAELGVGSILEGSVRKAGDRLRITLQLVDASSQEHKWSERFDCQLSDIFAIQTEVAESTAKAIRIELSERSRAAIRRPPTESLGAYDLYLRALRYRDEITSEGFRETVALLEEAIREDPQFALGHALLGNTFVAGAGDFLPHREGFSRARSCVMHALQIDPNLSDAHSALGNLMMQDEHDWSRAEGEFVHSLALNPSNSRARVHYATLLRVLGRYEEAERQARTATEIDPNWWTPRWIIVDIALERGEMGVAEELVRQLLRPDPNPVLTHLEFGAKYAELGRTDEARRELELAGKPSAPLLRIARAAVLSLLHDPTEARTLLDEVGSASDHEFISKDYVIGLYALVGERERALALLESTVKAAESGLWLRHRSFVFDSIRDDPRFEATLRSFHLPEQVFRRVSNPRSDP
jgi:TolB-like protein/Flp pilus assembly protein TadD